MNLATELYGFFTDTTFSVPLAQVAVFVVLVTLCMLLGRYRVGLVVTLGFVFFWSFVFNFRFFVDQLQNRRWGLQLYALSGLLMFALIILGLFRERSD
jgi:heme O synthase-like polyprenyltransferase